MYMCLISLEVERVTRNDEVTGSTPVLGCFLPATPAMICQKMAGRLIQEFRDLEERTFDEVEIMLGPDHPAYAGENAKKNRYMTLAPARQTLITVPQYVNANVISLGASQFIATQAPMQNTIADFYQMVYTHASRIVMLTRVQEENRRYRATKVSRKADVYWPELKEVLEAGDMFVYLRHYQRFINEIEIR